MFSSLPFYLSSWMVPGWLVGSNTLVQKFVIKDLHGATGQIHKTSFLAGIFSGTAVLVALRWAFTVLPCMPLLLFQVTDKSDIYYLSRSQSRFWCGVCDGNVLLHPGCCFGSRIHPPTGRNFRTKEDHRGARCPGRIRRSTFLHDLLCQEKPPKQTLPNL